MTDVPSPETPREQRCDDCGTPCLCFYAGQLQMSGRCCIHGEAECYGAAPPAGPTADAEFLREMDLIARTLRLASDPEGPWLCVNRVTARTACLLLEKAGSLFQRGER